MLQAAHSSAAQEEGMPPVRTEVKHPRLVREALTAACAHAVQEYGVHEKAVRRALARHYTEELQGQVVAHAAENVWLRAKVRELQQELESLRDVARVGYEPPPSGEVAELVAELQEQLALATFQLHLQNVPLYAVQQVTTLAQAANALDDGQVLGTLAQQLVLVRPLHVYDGEGAVLHHAEVQHGGAAVCTAAGLEQAGLPLPQVRA
jgi:hypothetical protein